MTSEAAGGGELSAKVLDFERIVKETVTQAKEPGFAPRAGVGWPSWWPSTNSNR